MVVQDSLMTVEKFWEQYADKPYELVEGTVVEMAPAGGKHGAVQRRVASRLGDYADEHDLGEVYTGEIGFQLTPNTMRAADVAFVSKERLKQITDPDKYIPFAPDLAVEVVSPGDTADEIQTKVKLYLEAGMRLVWVFYPKLKNVVVHHPDGSSQAIGLDGILDGEDVLPGLRIPVAKLFPPEQTGDE